MSKLLENIESPKDLKNLSPEQLGQVCQEIRETIVKQVASKGGHLASNLGCVELTVALHLEYNAPDDKIIWDVGHQAYPHKLLTGRYKQFHTLKQYQGISGFLKRTESEYDVFGAGHASTSLSAALGFAVARTKLGKDNHVVAIIGDGSLTGGMALEALNNAGVSNENVLYILNDNKMSIAPNVGALHKYLNHVLAHPTYNKLKTEVWNMTGKFPEGLGKNIRALAKKVDEGVKRSILPGSLFEDMGLQFYGPINGHDLLELRRMLRHLKTIQGPCLLHILTEKGHGFELAEQDSYKWHASTPFDPASGKRKAPENPVPTYAAMCGQILTDLGKKDPKIIAITAAMPDGTGLNIMEKELPGQVFDVGIAEQHAVTFAAGLACEGMKPVACIYSSFLQRAIDQVIHDVAIQKLNVTFLLSHSGLVGVDGPTHHGSMDITYLRMIPNMVIMSPANATELRNMIHTAYQYKDGPFTIRFSKGDALQYPPDEKIETYTFGVPQVVQTGEQVLFISVGNMLENAKQAIQILNKDGICPTLINARSIKPLDQAIYAELFQKHSFIVTLEDNVIAGGFGSAISELLNELGIYGKGILQIGLPDKFVTHGDVSVLQKLCGMDAESIATKVKNLMPKALSITTEL